VKQRTAECGVLALTGGAACQYLQRGWRRGIQPSIGDTPVSAAGGNTACWRRGVAESWRMAVPSLIRRSGWRRLMTRRRGQRHQRNGCRRHGYRRHHRWRAIGGMASIAMSYQPGHRQLSASII